MDYKVTVPAVVRDGFLAPCQDLVWFTGPTVEELKFVSVSEVDANFRRLLDALCQTRNAAETDTVPTLQDWLFRTLERLEMPGAGCTTWNDFERKDSKFAEAARVFLNAMDRELPASDPPVGRLPEGLLPDGAQSIAELHSDIFTTGLERYIRHGLRRSTHPRDIRLCEQAIDRLHLLGLQITETGSQACASPVTRILGYTHNKMRR